jgi:glycosyltransferase involved in cell wall biosynthesis
VVTGEHDLPSLSVVLPVYNGEGWVARAIGAVDQAISRAPFGASEIVVVDDGSTDGTVDEAKNAGTRTPVRVLSQANQGRFLARRRGLVEASGDLVLFVDSRVELHPDALAYVAPMLTDPRHQVWTAHVDIETDGNPIARFWRAIEHVAWRRYHGDPRPVTYGIDEFDFYPKGTTALLCPRSLIAAAYDDFTPTVADFTKVNDDTALLRYVARRQPINIAPGYSCTYHARTTLIGFLKHANHRGAVLIDGYLQPGARFAGEIRAVIALSPVGLLAALRWPRLAAASAVAGPLAATAIAKAKGAEGKDALVLGALSVPFGISYLLGMWRGVLSRAQLARRRIEPEGAAA